MNVKYKTRDQNHFYVYFWCMGVNGDLLVVSQGAATKPTSWTGLTQKWDGCGKVHEDRTVPKNMAYSWTPRDWEEIR